ncbi:hypothetical protein E2C01_020136 [Portunus trituberculatus]|uniref:Uncharacterized protein n=1 Tax=Portunus trituberculatus TaxID=210409 RepID=A0A5B7E0I0_PORTR|nr:hypothetical protein [Portunus trituberculatus]
MTKLWCRDRKASPPGSGLMVRGRGIAQLRTLTATASLTATGEARRSCFDCKLRRSIAFPFTASLSLLIACLAFIAKPRLKHTSVSVEKRIKIHTLRPSTSPGFENIRHLKHSGRAASNGFALSAVP